MRSRAGFQPKSCFLDFSPQFSDVASSSYSHWYCHFQYSLSLLETDFSCYFSWTFYALPRALAALIALASISSFQRTLEQVSVDLGSLFLWNQHVELLCLYLCLKRIANRLLLVNLQCQYPSRIRQSTLWTFLQLRGLPIP